MTTKTAAATTTTAAMNHLDSSFTLNQGSAKSGNDKQLMSAATGATAVASSPRTPQLCCSTTGSNNSSPGNNHNTTAIHFPCLPPKIPRTIRASPLFEHSIQDRNLPKNEGTISPLKIDEYIRETQPSSLHYYMGERHSDSMSSRLPPVPTEIRIPTSAGTAQEELPPPPGKNPGSSDDNQSWISNSYSTSSGHHHYHCQHQEEDYKTLYLCSQSDMHRLEQRNARVMEENRLLKRQLFEMQRQLYSYRRNNPVITTSIITSQHHKRRKISSNAADATATTTAAAAAPWSVPPSNLPQRSGAAGQVNHHQPRGGRGHVIVANMSSQRSSASVIKTPVRSNHHHQAIRFRRVSVEGQEEVHAAGRAVDDVAVAVVAVQQHLAMPRLTHAVSAEEGETVINNKSG